MVAGIGRDASDRAPAGVQPFWLTVFLDFPASEFEAGTAFWAQATGWPRSPLRGEHAEFASLVPQSGADYLRVQRLGSGQTRIHLDVHVSDPWEAAVAAEARGATVVTDSGHGLVVMRSPAGFEFCFTGQRRTGPPPSQQWPDGHRSRVGQVVLDIPPDGYEAEAAFWAATLGGRLAPSGDEPEFTGVDLTDSLPVRVLLQRLDLPQPMGGHLDLRSTDRPAEVARLQALGARVRAERWGWTVLEAPGGLSFCVVEQAPDLPGTD